MLVFFAQLSNEIRLFIIENDNTKRFCVAFKTVFASTHYKTYHINQGVFKTIFLKIYRIFNDYYLLYYLISDMPLI